MTQTIERTWNQKNLAADIYRLNDQIGNGTSHQTLGLFCQTAADSFEATPASTWGVEYESLKARVFNLKMAARQMQED